jgi:hypothetical protein
MSPPFNSFKTFKGLPRKSKRQQQLSKANLIKLRRCFGQLLRNGAAAEHRRCNLQKHRVSWTLLLSPLRGFSSHQNCLGCFNAVVEYAEQIARRGERVHFSVLDLKDEAAQTVQ